MDLLYSPKHIYKNIQIVAQNQDQYTLIANINQQKALIYAIEISEDVLLKFNKVNPIHASSNVRHQLFIQPIESPFVKFVKLKSQTPSYYYFTPFILQGKSLKESLLNNQKIDILKSIRHILKALQYLSQHELTIHGLLKPEHIFLSEERKYNSQCTIKLTPPPPKIFKVIQQNRIKEMHFYQPPEFFEEIETNQSDIWSLGLIFIEMCYEKSLKSFPQYQNKKFPALNVDFPYGFDFKKINQSFSQIIKKMLVKKSQDRIKLKQLAQLLQKLQIQLDKGPQFILPLVGSEARFASQHSRKEEIRQKNIFERQTQQKRVILNGFLLSLVYHFRKKILQLKLLFKKNLTEFSSVIYRYEQLPKQMKQRWQSLYELMRELSSMKKQNLQFLTDGTLSFHSKKPPLTQRQ